MPAPRIDAIGTPGIWFALSFAGMPRIYDVPLIPSLALIAVAFPVVVFMWLRMALEGGRVFFCLGYATTGIGYLFGLALFLAAKGEFQRTAIAGLYFGHVALGLWAVVRALRIGFQRNPRLIC